MSQQGFLPPKIRALFSSSLLYLSSALILVSWRWVRPVVQSVMDEIARVLAGKWIRNAVAGALWHSIYPHCSSVVLVAVGRYHTSASAALTQVQAVNAWLAWCAVLHQLCSPALKMGYMHFNWTSVKNYKHRRYNSGGCYSLLLLYFFWDWRWPYIEKYPSFT